MKVYKALFIDAKGVQTTIPVAAQSLQHAARKAAKEEKKHGENVKVETTTEIII